MKQILIALMTIGLAYTGAQAQTMQVCGVKNDKVCRRVAGHKTSCYKTRYAENFKVCKNNNGYYICCESPNHYNSTHPSFVVREEPRQYTYQANRNDIMAIPPAPQSQSYATAPQSQSYSTTSNNSYEGYYPTRGRIKVCYTGDNVAELNRAPYEGCPAPAYDGPDANRQRNVNVANPEPMPPLGGQPMQ